MIWRYPNRKVIYGVKFGQSLDPLKTASREFVLLDGPHCTASLKCPEIYFFTAKKTTRCSGCCQNFGPFYNLPFFIFDTENIFCVQNILKIEQILFSISKIFIFLKLNNEIFFISDCIFPKNNIFIRYFTMIVLRWSYI